MGRPNIRSEPDTAMMQRGKQLEGDLNHSHFSFVQLRKHLPSEVVLGSYSLPGCLDKAQSTISFPASENHKGGSGA